MNRISATAVGIAAVAAVYGAPALANGAQPHPKTVGDVLTDVNTHLQSAYTQDEQQREADVQKKAAALKEKHKTAKEKAEELREAKLAKDKADKYKAAYTGGDKKDKKERLAKNERRAADAPTAPKPDDKPVLTQISKNDLCDLTGVSSTVCKAANGAHADETPAWLQDDAVEAANFIEAGHVGTSIFSVQDSGSQSPLNYTAPRYTITWQYVPPAVDYGAGWSDDEDDGDDGSSGSGSSGSGSNGSGGSNGSNGTTITTHASSGPNGSGGSNYTLPTVGGAAPEPGVWAMMLVGFAGIGGLLRSRRRLVRA